MGGHHEASIGSFRLFTFAFRTGRCSGTGAAGSSGLEDEQGNPVAGAVITPDGLRAEKGHYFWRADRYGEPPTVITNTQGLVEVAYPKYASEKLETESVSFLINHPDFCPARPFHNVDRTDEPVVLKRGATLRVSGYLDSKKSTPNSAEDGSTAIHGSRSKRVYSKPVNYHPAHTLSDWPIYQKMESLISAMPKSSTLKKARPMNSNYNLNRAFVL